MDKDTKINETIVQFVDTIPEKTITVKVNVENLLHQRVELVKRKADSDKSFDADIAKLDVQIKRASDLGVTVDTILASKQAVLDAQLKTVDAQPTSVNTNPLLVKTVQ